MLNHMVVKRCLFNNSKQLLTISKCVVQKRNWMELSSVVHVLDEIAPLSLAEKWDNVGLLVESTENGKVDTILLTNDLTNNVLAEAVQKKANMIISYHPPIFTPLKSLRLNNWKERLIVKCVQSHISIYSPHTSLDAVIGGVNDWLIGCFDVESTKPIQQSFSSLCNYTHRIEFSVPADDILTEKLCSLSDIQSTSLSVGEGRKLIKICANNSSLLKIMESITSRPDILKTVEIYKMDKTPIIGHGMGRSGTLKNPITINEALNIIKKKLGLTHARMALGQNHHLDSTIKKVAVCAGSGSSVLRFAQADLYITGEMSHHDLLNATQQDITVILCEHSNSERGYLSHFADILHQKLQNVTIVISETDRDPVSIS